MVAAATAAMTASRALLTKVASKPTLSKAGAFIKEHATVNVLAGQAAGEGVRSTAVRSRAAQVMARKG